MVWWARPDSSNRSVDLVFVNGSFRQLQYRFLPDYQPQLHVPASTFVDVDRPPTIFVQPYKVRILPGIGRNVVPGKQTVIAGRHTIKMKATRCIGPAGIIEIKALATRRIRDKNDGRVRIRVFRVISNYDIQRTGIRANGNIKLSWAINVERRIQRINGAKSRRLDIASKFSG